MNQLSAVEVDPVDVDISNLGNPAVGHLDVNAAEAAVVVSGDGRFGDPLSCEAKTS